MEQEIETNNELATQKEDMVKNKKSIWSKKEVENLEMEYNKEGLDIMTIATKHNRTSLSIIFKLIQIGIIANQESARGFKEYLESPEYLKKVEIKKKIQIRKNIKEQKEKMMNNNIPINKLEYSGATVQELNQIKYNDDARLQALEQIRNEFNEIKKKVDNINDTIIKLDNAMTKLVAIIVSKQNI